MCCTFNDATKEERIGKRSKGLVLSGILYFNGADFLKMLLFY